MKKRVVVISLGGSIIAPDKIDYDFLHKFKKTLEKNYKKYHFVIVCGGGKIARLYIQALKEEGKSRKEQAIAGIRTTRMNALLMMQFFGKSANKTLPLPIKEVKNHLKKNNVVFCGALRYAEDETSDGTAVKIAHHLKSKFINMTNVQGLYDSNPIKNKNAKFIEKISWKDFEKMALKIKFAPGQHFVLDQNAAKIINEFKIPAYIIGKDVKNLNNLLNNKKFIGTVIEK